MDKKIKRALGIFLVVLGLALGLLNFRLTGAVVGTSGVTGWLSLVALLSLISGGSLVAGSGKTYIRSDAEKVNSLTSLVKKDSSLFRLARETTDGNERNRKEINHLLTELVKGNDRPGIDSHQLYGQIWEARAMNGARLYYRKGTKPSAYEILAYSDKHNQTAVINRLKKIYP